MKTALLYIFSFCIAIAAAAQDSATSRLKRCPEPSAWLFNMGYRLPVNKNKIINSGHGLYFEAGLNAGYLLPKKMTLGLFLGWAWKDGLWSTSFSNGFITDYNHAMASADRAYTGPDSAVVSLTKELFASKQGRSATLPGCEMRSFHNYSLYYGILIRLPLNHFPALKLYTGTTRSHYQGPGDLAGATGDHTIFELRRAMYGCELILFKSFQSSSRRQAEQKPANRYAGTFSIYYEYSDFYNASLYFQDGERNTNIRLKKFTSPGFLHKYRSELAWGFKVAFCLL